ncbi:hypothetical protein [Acidisoma sp. 7E03]
MALAADRVLDFRAVAPHGRYGYAVQAGFKVYRGSIVALCGDKTIVPAGAASPNPAAVKVVGVASHQQDNTSGALPGAWSGSGLVEVYRGWIALPFDAAPAGTNIGAPVYAVDDQTVSLSSSSNTRLQVGVLDGFDELGNPIVLI